MRYTIFSLHSSRHPYKRAIDAYLQSNHWEFVIPNTVNGSIPHELEKAQQRFPYKISERTAEGGPWRVGHLGIWYGVLDAIEHAPIVTFEDDALLGPNFNMRWTLTLNQMPKDTDFFSLFLPRDSDHLYSKKLDVTRWICRPYQKYGGVSMYYTPQGAAKIKKLLERDGLTDQYDNTLYAYAKAGELNGYCSKPSLQDLVYITGKEDSIVQESDIYAGIG
jgi:hypothetical protein